MRDFASKYALTPGLRTKPQSEPHPERFRLGSDTRMTDACRRRSSPNRLRVSSLIWVKRSPGPESKLGLDRLQNTPNVTKNPYAEFRELLRAQRRQLLGEVREKIAASGDGLGFANQSKITDDDGAADAAAEMEVAMVIRESQELQEIEAALARIGDGSYGACSDCGDDIGPARLKASPSARRCLVCQKKYERAQSHAHNAGP